MKRKKKTTQDEDGGYESVTTVETNAEVVEAYINYDLINNFADTYSPGTSYNFTHIFTRPQLRNMFGAVIDFNTLDPLNKYLDELSRIGFKENLSPTGQEPCIYVVEKEIPYIEAITPDEITCDED